MHRPLISVLTPSFGYGRFIEDAILSVKRQTYTNVEHVVADGGSADGTLETLRSHTKVRWVSEPDAGQSDALNKALAMSSGDVVGWLNADEFYLPGALETAAQQFVKTDADVVYGDAVFSDVDGRLLRLLPQHRFSSNVLRYYGCYIPSCAAFFRRSALGEDPWDSDAARIMDWDLYLTLYERGARFAYVPQTLGVYRIHPAQVTSERMSFDAPEARRIRYRHAIQDPRRARLKRIFARLEHVALKGLAGGYRRQVLAHRQRGRGLQWW